MSCSPGQPCRRLPSTTPAAALDVPSTTPSSNGRTTQDLLNRTIDVMAERAKLRKRRQALQDEIMNKQVQCAGIRKKEDELDDEWNRLVLLLLSQVVPAEAPESNSEQTSAYESADEPSLTMADGEHPPEQVTSEMDSEACTRALQQLFADDPLFTIPLEGLNYSLLTQSTPRKHSLNDSIADTPDSSIAPKKRRKLQKYSLAELRMYTANINRHWDRHTKQFQCPLCDMDSRKPTAYKAYLHFLDHLGEERFFPYKCPAEDCKYASVQHSSVQTHCTGVHKMIWTDELKATSTDAKNKALILSVFDEGMCVLPEAKVEPQE